MSENPNNILVGVSGNLVFIKVQGKGGFQISQPLRQFSLEMIGRGYREFVVDLAECTSMDSTFLGVLAGMGLRLQAADNTASASGKVHLANVNARCREVLSSLGIDKLFTIDLCDLRVGPASPVSQPAGEMQSLQTAPASGDMAKQAEVMLEAHRTLMAIDPQNVPKFKDCVRFLAEDLEKMRAAQKTGA
ncbi:MAG: STAS domain-containing protein [Verrucomicrobiae bacterium]|nr:STAS domain-containing protein [Verrucomicrobiae bacterium]